MAYYSVIFHNEKLFSDIAIIVFKSSALSWEREDLSILLLILIVNSLMSSLLFISLIFVTYCFRK